MSAHENSIPKWDVALAALADDEFRRKGAAMTLNDFRNLARQHTIRLDDIMETLFLLVINGQWIYLDSDGRAQALNQETLDRLYIKRRLSDKDLQEFDGSWQPA